MPRMVEISNEEADRIFSESRKKRTAVDEAKDRLRGMKLGVAYAVTLDPDEKEHQFRYQMTKAANALGYQIQVVRVVHPETQAVTLLYRVVSRDPASTPAVNKAVG